MSLTSLSFLGIYFPLLLIAYYNPYFKSNYTRKIILLCASIGLYAFCEPVYTLLLIGLIWVNYLLVQNAERNNKNFYRTIAIVIDVVVLVSFKYINKVLEFAMVNENISSIAFPIGLSYFTFKAISYVVDSRAVKDGKLVDVALYISNFLTIVSGPLSKYRDELPTILEKKTVTIDWAYKGLVRLMVGLAKKVIIADSLGVLVAQCFSSHELSFVMAWTGAVAYTLQLYFDFSGYTDMVIGIGYLFGYNLPENFNYPYMAKSVSDFWKRWHMSLTKWFTTYIYFPLGGSRVKTVSRHIFNLFVVWLVTGMWHGSNFTFIVWGLIYFVFQMLEKYTGITTVLNKLCLGHIYTMMIVIVEWVIFRSATIEASVSFIKSMFLLNGNPLILSSDILIIEQYIIPLLLGVIFATNIGDKIKNVMADKWVTRCIYNLGLIALFVVCIIISMSQGYTSPLYAGF